MSSNRFTEMMSKKSTEELIELYNTGLKGKNYLDPESFEAVKAELSKREIAEDQIGNFKGSNITKTLHNETHQNDNKRYPALRTIASIFTAFAWLTGVLAIIIAIYLFGQGGQNSWLVALPTIVISAIVVLAILAASESIKVIIDIEDNTRRAVQK